MPLILDGEVVNDTLNHINKTSAQLIAVILGSVKREFNDEWDIFLPDTLRLNKFYRWTSHR